MSGRWEIPNGASLTTNLVIRGLFGMTLVMGVLFTIGGVGMLAALSPPGLCVLPFGLLMLVFGGAVALGTGSRWVDAERKTAGKQWGLVGIPLQKTEHSNELVTEVLVERLFSEQELYRVALLGLEPPMEMFRSSASGTARGVARKVARALERPLRDRTGPGGEPDELVDADSTFVDRDRPEPSPHEPAAIDFQEFDTGAVFVFPKKGFGFIEGTLAAAPLAMGGIFVAMGLLLLLLRGGVLDAVMTIGMGVFVGALFGFLVWPVVRFVQTGHTVEVGRELVIQETGLGRRRVVIPTDELDRIVHVTTEQMRATPGQRLRSGEVLISHLGGDLHLGSGQPEADLAWAAAMLSHLVVRYSA